MNSKYDCFKIVLLLKELYSKTMYSIEDNFKEESLTYQQIIVIKLIAHNNDLTISDLCKEMSLAKGAVSGIVTKLKQGGYVEKFKNETDKRNTYLKFTDKGRSFAFEFRSKIQKSFENTFRNCDNEDLYELTLSFKNILSKIKE